MDTLLAFTSSLASKLDAGWQDDTAVTAIEYGLLASLIVVTCVGAFTNYAVALNNLFQTWVVPVLAAA